MVLGDWMRVAQTVATIAAVLLPWPYATASGVLTLPTPRPTGAHVKLTGVEEDELVQEVVARAGEEKTIDSELPAK